MRAIFFSVNLFLDMMRARSVIHLPNTFYHMLYGPREIGEMDDYIAIKP